MMVDAEVDEAALSELSTPTTLLLPAESGTLGA